MEIVERLRSHQSLQLGDRLAAADEIERLRAELAECKRDAERYQWLRHHPSMYGAARIARSPAALDIMIDAALAAREE